MMSLKDKMAYAYHLAVNIDPSVDEDVAAWQDGLWHKYLLDRIERRCSLADYLSFDVGAFEQEVGGQIDRLELLRGEQNGKKEK